MRPWTDYEINIIADYSPRDASRILIKRTPNDCTQARLRHGKGDAVSTVSVRDIESRSRRLAALWVDCPSLNPDVNDLIDRVLR